MHHHPFSRVLITGTTSGLGRAFHKFYSEQNIEVIEVNRRAIDTEYPTLHSDVLDITNSGEVFTCLMKLKREDKLPDLFILNAGVNIPDCINGFDLQSFSKVMSTNLMGVVTFISAIHRLGLKNKTIVTISSTSNIIPNSANIAYHLSKLNLKVITEQLSLRDPGNRYKTVVLSPVHSNIQVHSPPSPGLTKFLFNLLAVSPDKAAKKCASFFNRSGTVYYFTKTATAFYLAVKVLLFFFPFLYKGSKNPVPKSSSFVAQTQS